MHVCHHVHLLQAASRPGSSLLISDFAATGGRGWNEMQINGSIHLSQLLPKSNPARRPATATATGADCESFIMLMTLAGGIEQ